MIINKLNFNIMNDLQKELPKRFTDAVSKLYNAFHNGELNAMDCKHCAVGNICDNSMFWSDLSTGLGVYSENPSQKALLAIQHTGYDRFQIIDIENVFMEAMGLGNYLMMDNTIKIGKDKELQFKGLCAVIEYLCELDNIPNIMDYKSLFETNDKKEPINQLNF